MDLFKAIVDVWNPRLTSQSVSESDRDIRSVSSEPRHQNTIQIAELESRINVQINRHRNSLGLKSVEKISQLDRIALEHTESMKRSNRPSHDGSSGRNSQVLRMGFRGFGENCAGGECEDWEFSAQFDLLVPGWIKSPGHKQNLETASHTHTGIGFAARVEGSRIYYFATQIFAS
jgi:uncharacterized protein YkwD